MTIFTYEFWITLAFGVLWICGVWTAFRPGMVFGDLADIVEAALKAWFGHERGEYIAKPLFRCPPCMSSIHGSYVWIVAGGSWEMLGPFVICLCGINSFLFLVFTEKE